MEILCIKDTFKTLTDFADASQVIIAIVNVLLASYIFFYQIRKDKKSEYLTAKLNEQNIKLQWFKELIVQPRFSLVQSFYNNLFIHCEKLMQKDLLVSDLEEINELVKSESIKIRKEFIDVILFIDKEFYQLLLANIDDLVDTITVEIFDSGTDLSDQKVYNKRISSKITYSNHSFISQLYNYKGVPSEI